MVKRSRDTAFLAGAIYFIQGTLGISGIALPLYLRHLNWDIAEITMISSLAALPWLLKIFFAFFSDTFPLFGYRRKSYLIIFSLIAAFGWLCLSLLPSQKGYVLASMLLTNLGFAVTDVITDGVVVEHSTDSVSRMYQSIAWGFRGAGSVLSGLVSGWLAIHWQSQDIFRLTMLLPLCVCFCSVLLTEKHQESGGSLKISDFMKRSFQLLTQSNLKNFSIILFLLSISASFGVPFFFHMKENLNFPETFLGYLSSLGWGGAVIGSLVYAKWLQHFPPRKMIQW